MTNILLCGACGTMGRNVIKTALNFDGVKIVAGYDIKSTEEFGFPIYTSLSEIDEKADAIIDFSHPSLTDGILDYAEENKIPVVICTTGLSGEQNAHIKSASQKTAVFYSANMSLGVNLIIDLVQSAARVLEDNFDIEIIEKHHNQKIDAPSGTALAIADAIAETVSYEPEYTYDRHSVRKKRDKAEIGIHSLRGGTIVGEHSVVFAGRDETIEIKHTATSKEVFAVGAVKAAVFVDGTAPGLYSMKDLIKQEL